MGLKIDARARLIAGMILVASVMAIPVGVGLWIAGGFVLFMLIIVRGELRRVITPLYALGWMFLLTIVIQGLSTPGHILWDWEAANLTLTEEGVIRGVLLSGRLAGATIVAGILLVSIGSLEGIRALESMLKPLKKIGIPVGSATLVLALALRFVPTLYDEAMQLKKALIARGWSPGKGIISRVRAWLPLIVPILVSGLRRADDLARSLVIRGYNPEGERTSLHVLRWGGRETLLVVAGCLPLIIFGMEKVIIH
ncbi:energy-coupling factor transporter transmembrane protein EcfT [bacterium]|nr:energy-coupling factor transporter transmembrane protein EcfT [bacterium]